MHELVGLSPSMMHAVVGSCRDETRMSEHIGISPAEEGWTVANNKEIYLVAALTRYVLQHTVVFNFHDVNIALHDLSMCTKPCDGTSQHLSH
jgi:hypothetical protein